MDRFLHSIPPARALAPAPSSGRLHMNSERSIGPRPRLFLIATAFGPGSDPPPRADLP
jgi:hypothetical protein